MQGQGYNQQGNMGPQGNINMGKIPKFYFQMAVLVTIIISFLYKVVEGIVCIPSFIHVLHVYDIAFAHCIWALHFHILRFQHGTSFIMYVDEKQIYDIQYFIVLCCYLFLIHGVIDAASLWLRLVLGPNEFSIVKVMLLLSHLFLIRWTRLQQSDGRL